MYKIPKGCVDLVGDGFYQFQHIKNIIETEFLKNAGKPLETPIFERKDVLMGKYGEEAENKLVYNIEENGGESLTLRYDLTVPFIRYIKENKIDKMRRYAIGKVYRRDQPNESSGRLREFYQADFDIYGENDNTILSEATLLHMAVKVLKQLKIDNYTIYINDINNLKEILINKLKIPLNRWKSVCQIIDKLDKYSFDNLVVEFKQVYENIDLNQLKDYLSYTNPINQITIANWKELYEICKIWGFNDKIQYQTSLARGLDYYSGFVWEIKLDNCPSTIISGGRYDILLNKSLVGISFGLSRIMLIYSNNWNIVPITWKNVYYIATMNNVPIEYKATIIKKIEDAFPNAAVIYSFDKNESKLTKSIQKCIKLLYKYVVIIGENEFKNQSFIIKDLELKKEINMNIKNDII
jgi:histidyl-tRNA synthetase